MPAGNFLNGGLESHAEEHAGLESFVIASRSLSNEDNGRLLKCSSSSSIVLTIPNDSTSAWSGLVQIAAYQSGTGAVSFSAGSGVTLRGTAPSGGQFKTIGVMRVGANEWAYIAS